MKTIGILARPDLSEARVALRELVQWLHQRGLEVCLDEQTAALVGASLPACTVAAAPEVAGRADALVVLGGDGTLLAASHLLEGPVPVLGVNFGSLGFLTEITLADLYPTLLGVLDGTYGYDERRMLRAQVTRD